MCGKYFKKTRIITEKMKLNFLKFAVKDTKISDVFYKMQNFQRTSWASIITTSHIKLLIADLLVDKLIPTTLTIPTNPTIPTIPTIPSISTA